jgi:hypothetical protein
MAKKRFTDDLFGLFEDPFGGDASVDQPVEIAGKQAPEEDTTTERVEVQIPAPSPKAKRKLSSKKFTLDLDAFLSDSFAKEANPASNPSSAPASAPRPRRRRKTGLDLLIQSTVTDEDRSPRGEKTPDTKRVTLIFDKTHLAELKVQAKDRGMYLKDVVQEMVSSYLEK